MLYLSSRTVSDVVSTEAAALSKWNPLTDLIPSTTKLSTYNSPPFSEMTARSGVMNSATAQSSVSFTLSSWPAGTRVRHAIHIGDVLFCLTHVLRCPLWNLLWN